MMSLEGGAMLMKRAGLGDGGHNNIIFRRSGGTRFE